MTWGFEFPTLFSIIGAFWISIFIKLWTFLFTTSTFALCLLNVFYFRLILYFQSSLGGYFAQCWVFPHKNLACAVKRIWWQCSFLLERKLPLQRSKRLATINGMLIQGSFKCHDNLKKTMDNEIFVETKTNDNEYTLGIVFSWSSNLLVFYGLNSFKVSCKLALGLYMRRLLLILVFVSFLQQQYVVPYLEILPK